MGIYALRVADGIDISQHGIAAAMGSAATFAALRRRVGECRMVRGQQHGALKIVSLDALELRGEERKLNVRHTFPFSRLARNQAWIFERVTEHTNDPHKRSVEREVNAGLRHGCAVQRTGFGRYDRARRAEVAHENLERLRGHGRARDDEGIMVARNRQNWRWIVSVRLIKLIVVILGLAKV